ncbi:MAG TPA: ATP-binding cassette domain-containing protein, partial [Phenylobacterium sp.]
MAEPQIELRDVAKRYEGTAALEAVSLTVAAGEFVALVGGSGSGKTTLLKTINGLVRPDAGSVRIAGQEAAGLAPHELRRRIGYVFQEIGLFPHLTVEENIAITPRLMGWDAPRRTARAAELLELVA